MVKCANNTAKTNKKKLSYLLCHNKQKQAREEIISFFLFFQSRKNKIKLYSSIVKMNTFFALLLCMIKESVFSVNFFLFLKRN